MKHQDCQDPTVVRSEIMRLRKKAAFQGMTNVLRFLDILFCRLGKAHGKGKIIQEIDREVKKLKGEYFPS